MPAPALPFVTLKSDTVFDKEIADDTERVSNGFPDEKHHEVTHSTNESAEVEQGLAKMKAMTQVWSRTDLYIAYFGYAASISASTTSL